MATQLTLILAMTSVHAAAAWPILNSAGLLAMVMASVVLHEKSHRYQTAILLLVVALGTVRYLTF